ncbi:MFS transporter [Halorubrum sp. DTA46]|uniref:MFS transporter n=1 Tax=Halorubrum sp. DTA46 TaxID=3402162 RepID=UPI003AAB1722
MSLYTQFVRNAREMAADLARDGNGWVLAAVGAGWFLSIGIRYIYPSILPFLREAFAMDLTVAGFLLSALWLAYALGQFPGGVLGDRYGEGNILVASTVISTVALLLVVFSFSLWTLFAATVAFGFATGLYGPHRFTIFTDIYTDRAGTAVGITMAAGSIGNTVLPAIAVAIAGYASWRLGFGVLIPLFVVVSVSIYLFVPKRTSQSTGDTDTFSMDTLRQLRTAVVGGGIPLVVGIHIVTAFVSNGFLGFYPTYLIEVKGFSAQTAALLYGSYFALGVVIQPMTGMLRDWFGSKWTLMLVAGMFFLGLVALQLAVSVVHIVALTVLLSHRNGLGVVTNTFIANTLDDSIKGSGLGLLRTSWILTGAMSPIFVGFLGDLGQLNFAFLVLAGIAGVATLMTLLVPRE